MKSKKNPRIPLPDMEDPEVRKNFKKISEEEFIALFQEHINQLRKKQKKK